MSETRTWYVHRPLGEPLRAIGGTALLLREDRLETPDGEVLYVVGGVRMDSTCCGDGGCGYALVQGFVERWKPFKTVDGYDVSEIGIVARQDLRETIEAAIVAREAVQSLSFRDA